MSFEAWRCKGIPEEPNEYTGEVIGSYMERDGRSFIIPETGTLKLVPVKKESVHWELNTKDMDGTPLFDGDTVINPENEETFFLKYDENFPYCHINPFALPRPDAVRKLG